MNITFLIGNGFDVGVGMHSKFKEFFPTYRDASKTKPDRIKQLSDKIEEDYETWADFEAALGEYTAEFTPETKQDFIDQVEDFEKEFIEYLKKEESNLSFEESEDICAIMLKALTQYYLDDNLAWESMNELSTLYRTHAEDDHRYNFVNFNYTDVLAKCLNTITDNVVCKRNYRGQRVDKIGAIVHVHGEIGSYPIIGVNDIGQIANKELSEDPQFTKFIVKPSINKLIRRGNDINAMKLIESSAVLCIYGMSLGATDKKWWDSVIAWLNNKQERQLVLFDYDEEFTASSPIVWIEKEDSKIEKLTQYNSDKNINIENLRSRIHIAVHKNIFKMDLSKDTVNERKISQIKKDAEKASEEVRWEKFMNEVLEKTGV